MASENSFKFMHYYSEQVSFWDRSTWDTRKVIAPHIYSFEKVFPITNAPKDFKLLS